jgi:NAD(P)-dependent dehydrogenase (short-subunit alcohol dehydrogenase family)
MSMAATIPPGRADQTPIPDYKKLFDLTDRVMVVLGGGNGIGRQTCHALAQAGASVVCVDRDHALAEAVATEVKGVPLVGDVTQRDEVERIFAAAAKHGPIRGAIDIVGMPLLGPLANLDDRDWATQFDLVLTHAFLAMQVGGKAIAEAGGGSMMFVASMSGLTQVPGQVAYGAAKAALIQLVAGMGLELGPSHVRVNAVAPGFVRTPRLNTMLSESNWGEIGKHIPLGAPASPAEIAAPILFLCSDMASHITGQTLLVDGGMAGVVNLPRLAVTGH